MTQRKNNPVRQVFEVEKANLRRAAKQNIKPGPSQPVILVSAVGLVLGTAAAMAVYRWFMKRKKQKNRSTTHSLASQA